MIIEEEVVFHDLVVGSGEAFLELSDLLQEDNEAKEGLDQEMNEQEGDEQQPVGGILDDEQLSLSLSIHPILVDSSDSSVNVPTSLAPEEIEQVVDIVLALPHNNLLIYHRMSK
uniref:Uncharacterized protein n=1 Tax=Arundo donax TaxID=35708 RepID=A0A0A8ZN28_ARUDO